MGYWKGKHGVWCTDTHYRTCIRCESTNIKILDAIYHGNMFKYRVHCCDCDLTFWYKEIKSWLIKTKEDKP